MASSGNMSTSDKFSRELRTLQVVVGVGLLLMAAIEIVGLVLGSGGVRFQGQHGNGTQSPSPPAPSSPIVVRGGAITIRSNDPNGWQSTVAQVAPFCSDTDATYIELDDVSLIPPPQGGQIGKALARGDVTMNNLVVNGQNGWEIDVYGRNGAGNSVSANGISLTAATGDCSTGSSPYKVMLNALNSSSSFYLAPMLDENLSDQSGYHTERFQNKDTTCVTSNSTDEDLCERMSQVNLKLTTGGQTVSQTYECPNGECVIHIGKSSQ
jgi:hypothetical protein